MSPRAVLSRASALLAFVAVLVLAFAGTALAAGAIAPEDGALIDLARPVFDAVMAGNYIAAAALALVAAVAVAKRYGAPRWSFLGTGAGAALLVVVGSFGGAIATATLAGAGLSAGLLYMAGKVAVIAGGGYSLIKALLVEPVLRPLAARAPKWLQPVFALVFWFFDRPTPVAKAEAAGAAAVAAKPGTGASSVVGRPRDLP
jgi:hypothetical protein